MKTIVIATPTGNVGSKLIPHLAQAARRRELELVLLARRPHAVAHWAGNGVRVHAGHLEDPEFLVGATRGASALYWATPNSFAPGITMRQGYRQFAEAAARAITANQIAHTVHLSGFAHVDDGGGDRSMFGALAETEAILGGAVDALQQEFPRKTYGITHLRAGFLYENFLGQLDSIRDNGRIFLPVNQRRRIPMVASHDVADRVLELLVTNPHGRVYAGAFGPEDLSFAQAAASMTAGLGRPVRVYRLPRLVIRAQMLKLGRDPRAVDAFMVSFKAITEGKVTADPPRDDRSTTPMSLTRWADEVLRPLVDGLDGAACPVRAQYVPPPAVRA